MTGWDEESEARDEQRCTPHASTGWSSWNCKSPEVEFCEFAAALVALYRPSVVIETGIGQGYVTRRVMKALPETSKLLCFESDIAWRGMLEGLPFFENERVSLGAEPSAEDFSSAQVSILDSSFGQRKRELRLWKEFAPAGSVLLVHDVTELHDPSHVCRRLYDEIRGLDVNGIFLPNPRGGFLAWK